MEDATHSWWMYFSFLWKTKDPDKVPQTQNFERWSNTFTMFLILSKKNLSNLGRKLHRRRKAFRWGNDLWKFLAKSCRRNEEDEDWGPSRQKYRPWASKSQGTPGQISRQDFDLIIIIVCLLWLQSRLVTGMGEISKWRQLNDKIWYRAVWDLSFYKTRWILKFSFKHRLKKEIDILYGLNRLDWYFSYYLF